MLLDAVSVFGLVGDGLTDNYAAFRRAVTDPRLSRGGALEFPPGDYRVVLPQGVSELCRLTSELTLRGTAGATSLSIASAADEFKQPFRSATNDTRGARFEGLTIRRTSPWYGCLIALDAGDGIAFRDCVLDGGMANAAIKSAKSYIFGVYYAASDVTHSLHDLRFDDVDFTGCAPAVGSPNQGFATVRGMHFNRCRFYGNYASDLELNAPNQTAAQEQTNTVPPDRPFLQSFIRIRDCMFEDNRSQGPSGYAIGIAHLRDVLIDGCSFAGYWNHAVHVEDYSESIGIRGGTFSGCCSGGDGGAVTVITCARAVSVAGSTFDMTAVTNPRASCVSVQPGALPGQYHQCPDPRPCYVGVVGNAFRLGPTAAGVVNIGCVGVDLTANAWLDGTPSRQVLGGGP
jgi:hypothetical protein